ncbi:MAG: hypothetical protein M1839_008170 [Geoglossum umbratile]|nr:MAG: hypothetical protein M1839_008170 [Geoglossum umbratile]
MSSEHTGYSEVDVPVEAIQVIDPNVVASLPSGTRIASITPHGASFWTRTARLDAELDGEPRVFFLKTTCGDRGKGMVSGEFASMSAIYAVTPDLVPHPIAWGTYASIPAVHFFICDFHNMTDGLPDIHAFTAKMAELHSKGTSSNGKYGFPIATHHGHTALDHGWADKWEEYFTTKTKALLQLEQQVQGLNKEIEALMEPFFTKVMPRLLRPLETGGRGIKPCLVHGDLWHGNATTDADTNRPIIFDAGSFYAHNEYDLGVWRASWNKIGNSYITHYHKHFPISAPEEDYDDRGALYAMFIAEMERLVKKFPDGYEGWERAQG